MLSNRPSSLLNEIMSKTILIIEDEPAIREMVSIALSGSGFNLIEASDANSAERAIGQSMPSLILLDLMLPDINGLDFTRRLKTDEFTRDVALIILTARTEESNKIRGLELGADDYVTKPFSPKELIARIKAVLRRSQAMDAGDILCIGDLKLDPSSHRISVNDHIVNMGPTEYRLLHFFLTHRERVYSRTQLLDRVWGRNAYVEERTVDVHIRRLRKCLAPRGYDRYIQTVRGAGYRFSEQN